ncbi:MAG: DUF3833 domain-containing protein [Limnobacter sp.]|nr:DUF3833 domain-containing protein [Limnobacter sp.]
MITLKKTATTLLASLGIATTLLLSACAGPTPTDYAEQTPKLDLQTYFNGTIDAWGVVQDRSGKVIKRFSVVMKCNWMGNTGTLDEQFTYADGTTQQRIWTVVKKGNEYTGTAADVKGQATGIAAGNALNWSYTLLLPIDNSVYEIQFDDWLYLMDEKTMLNRAVMSKLGFRIGEVF